MDVKKTASGKNRVTPDQIRFKYLDFFKKSPRRHVIIPSASLVPENDPTTLFTGSGMQPLVPYLLGQKHPQGDRLADSQKSFRSADIDEVGDNRHTTFFEMLGNWSLGGYFKKEQLQWCFEFLTSKVGLDPNKLYVTVFLGDPKNNIPKDTEAAAIWKKLFKKHGIEAEEVELGSVENGSKMGTQNGRIFYYDAAKNWWSRSGVPSAMPAGEPGGPDSEVFYEFEDIKHDQRYGAYCHPNCDCGRFLEIGNSVFMEYQKNADGTFSKLSQKNVDFGGGLERMAMAANDVPDIIEINHRHALDFLELVSGKKYERGYGEENKNAGAETAAFRIIADHMKAAVFLIGDGVLPSNTDRGYFVRRLLRRAVRYSDTLGIKTSKLSALVDPILESYKEAYPETYSKAAFIKKEIAKEEEKFRKTLDRGLQELKRLLDKKPSDSEAVSGAVPVTISGKDAFDLYQSFGLPFELTKEIVAELRKEQPDDQFSRNRPSVQKIDDTVAGKVFFEELKKHRELSRAGAEKKFKGGLGDTGEMSVKYHTATHLLNAALRKVLGPSVGQKGSNITPERLRFDFSWPEKLTDEQKKEVEDLVNAWIVADLPVSYEEMQRAEAEKVAIHAFGGKYGDVVKVYSIGSEASGGYVSREFCGGPHVTHTAVLGHFEIQKEEAVSAGVRRLRAVLK